MSLSSIGGISCALANSALSPVVCYLKSGPTVATLTGTTGARDGVWHHVLLTWTQFAGGPSRLYVDGALQASASNSGSWTWDPNIVTRWGASGDGFWGRLNGQVDGMAWWSSTLTGQDASGLYADSWAMYRRPAVRLPAPAPAYWLPRPAAPPVTVAGWHPDNPAPGWGPHLAAGRAPDLLPWLPRVTVPPPPRPAAPRLSPWSAALAPAPDSSVPWLSRVPAAPPPAAAGPQSLGWSAALAPAFPPVPWLARPVPAPPASAPPAPAAPHAGWRPELAASFAPAVRHALVRFWRGPEAHMPRLEDGEPAWATDTKSLWMGSASGNVRIGP